MNETTTAGWPKYRSHKIVEAARITLIDDYGTIWVRSAPTAPVQPFQPTVEGMAKTAEVGGFAIIYEDGFKSISPARVFLDGYSEVVEEVEHKQAFAVARVCHEVNRAICEAAGDMSQKPWFEAEQWQMNSAVRGVQYALAHPDATPEQQHEAWMADKLADGWVWGATKDPDAKTHPCLVAYHLLPFEQRVKDHAFRAVVGALTA